MLNPKVVMLVFVSGKVVITGAKTREEIYEAFNNLYPILKGFKKTLTNQNLKITFICLTKMIIKFFLSM